MVRLSGHGRIVFDNLSKTFPRPASRTERRAASTAALRDVSLEIPAGSIYGIIGYSGAGKSTLIRTVNGLETPTSGRVLVDDLDIGALRGSALREAQKRSGMIFQQFNLLDTVRARDNVALPLRLDGVSKRRAHARAEEALAFVGLGDKADSHPNELSGGQKQRVGIARALVRRPDILLSDEATSALDPTTTGQIIALLRDINREYGTTIVVVTHEMDVVANLAERVAVMQDGAVVEEGSVLDVFTHPSAEITRDFVASVVSPHTSPRVVAAIGSGDLWRLLLLDDQVSQPLLSTLVSDFGVSVNMLHAETIEIRDHTVGQMVLHAEGPADRVAAARAYLESRVVSVEEVAV